MSPFCSKPCRIWRLQCLRRLERLCEAEAAQRGRGTRTSSSRQEQTSPPWLPARSRGPRSCAVAGACLLLLGKPQPPPRGREGNCSRPRAALTSQTAEQGAPGPSRTRLSRRFPGTVPGALPPVSRGPRRQQGVGQEQVPEACVGMCAPAQSPHAVFPCNHVLKYKIQKYEIRRNYNNPGLLK